MPEPLQLASFDVEVCQLYPVSLMTRQKLVIQTTSFGRLGSVKKNEDTNIRLGLKKNEGTRAI